MFLQEIGSNSYADGDEVLDGVCEVCHTQTLYHRNDPGGDHGHYAGSRCTVCHTHDLGFSPASPAGVADPRSALPRIVLSPSPSRGPMTIRIEGFPDPGGVRASILDVSGRELVRLPPGPGGPVVLRWDGRTAGGEDVVPGVYFLRVEAGAATATRRFVVIR